MSNNQPASKAGTEARTPVPVDLNPAIIAGSIALAIAIIGWVVQAVVTRITTAISRAQLDIGKGQLEVGRHNLVLTLLPRRLDCHQALEEAIAARNKEIVGTDFTRLPFPDAAHAQLWKAQRLARLLFDDQVMQHVDRILGLLDEKARILGQIRTDPDYPRSLHEKNAQVSLEIELTSGAITAAIRESQFVGMIRSPIA